MALNDISDVKDILEVPGDVSDQSLEAFLADAALFVEEELTGKGLSTARMKTIEKYVACHFALMLTERGGLASSRQGESQDNYTVLSAMGNGQIGGLQLTRYGQQAIILDTTGTLLAASMNKIKARFSVNSEFENAQSTALIFPPQ